MRSQVILLLQVWEPDSGNHWLGRSRQIVTEMGSFLRQRQRGGREKIQSQSSTQAGGPAPACSWEVSWAPSVPAAPSSCEAVERWRRYKGEGVRALVLVYRPGSATHCLLIFLCLHFPSWKMGIATLARQIYNALRMK